MRHFIFILILVAFLCVNGITCVSCLISELYHHFHIHLTHTDNVEAECTCCWADHHPKSEPIPDHEYIDSDAHTHSCTCQVQLAQAAVKDLMPSFEVQEIGTWLTTAPRFVEIRFVHEKLRKWFYTCESLPDSCLYLQNAQWLI